ncbi:hypothetical protein ABZ135_23200 [Streptomyces sp. NPDC006339]|uniref:hypothetical protein n=1 Tax=Streptomyces sp. NPDC006339 TaxID=3156755 RepID=UPI0033BFB1AF
MRIAPRVALVTSVALLGLASATGPASPSPVTLGENQDYITQAAAQDVKLENAARAGVVLDEETGGGVNAGVGAYHRKGGRDGVWEVLPAADSVLLRKWSGGEELCAAAWPNEMMADVSMQPCGAIGAKWWDEIAVGSNRYVYRSAEKGTCMAATRENAAVELVECAFEDPAQQWVKRPR